MSTMSFAAKLLYYAQDMYDAEVKIGGRLPQLIEQVTSQRSRRLLRIHLEESERRTARLQTALAAAIPNRS
ncbi:MAG: DUF892 family protein [Bdellovibrionota bacterium]